MFAIVPCHHCGSYGAAHFPGIGLTLRTWTAPMPQPLCRSCCLVLPSVCYALKASWGHPRLSSRPAELLSQLPPEHAACCPSGAPTRAQSVSPNEVQRPSCSTFCTTQHQPHRHAPPDPCPAPPCLTSAPYSGVRLSGGSPRGRSWPPTSRRRMKDCGMGGACRISTRQGNSGEKGATGGSPWLHANHTSASAS